MAEERKDVIELENIQKIRELEVEDRYKVLEYLVRELIGLRGEKQGKNKESEESDEDQEDKKKKDKKKKNKKSY